MTPFEELANAIVIQAAKDYMKALKKLKNIRGMQKQGRRGMIVRVSSVPRGTAH